MIREVTFSNLGNKLSLRNISAKYILYKTMSLSPVKGYLGDFITRKVMPHRQNLSELSKGVAVDIRKSSPTYGKHIMVELNEDNKRQLFIPRGFAHGFLVLSDEAVFTYKVDNPYAPQSEAGIRWDDPDLHIQWPINADEIITSEKDLTHPVMKDAELFE